MERVPGHDLKHHLAHEGALTPGQVAELGLDLTEGLQHLHQQGFLHRDIKPANVLLARSDIERTRGKLADFGIASIIGVPEDGEYTTGTAAYISPEQVEDGTPPSPPTSTPSAWCSSRRSPGTSPTRAASRRPRWPACSGTRTSRPPSRPRWPRSCVG